MNGYNQQSDRLMEAMATRDRRYTRSGIGYRPGVAEASSSDLPPWLRDRKVKEAHLSVTVCAGDGEDGMDYGDMDYEDMRQRGMVPESALYPQRPFRETLERTSEAEMTTKQRNRLPKTAFAIPEDRAYPINDLAHARNALARVAQFGSPEEQRRVRNAVYRKFPQLNPNKKK